MDFYHFPFLLLFFQSFTTDFGSLPVFAYNSVYRPLRIYPYFGDNLNSELNEDEGQVLKNTVNNVILYVRKILSVKPKKGSLLLTRNACKSSWTTGRNAGKCATIRKDYVGEFCIDNFLIPDEHLEAFYTWTGRPLPDRTWFTDGVGVKNADYILYVQALSTKSCLSNFSPGSSENTLIAYASFCKLGENDRPVAGYINFCASEFRKYVNNRNKLILITLHEVFHALGFSKDLILNFRDFREAAFDKYEIPHYSFPTLRESNGTYRLLTPTVIAKMQEHFDCQLSGMNFPDGAPMTTKDNILQSHWDSTVLPGTIMTSKLGKPEYTFVDPITLALFQDTGWYDVNFANGDSYRWGLKKGCDFLKALNLKEISDFQKNLCSSDSSSGCNYLQTEVIDCSNSGLFFTSNSDEKSIHDCRYNSSGSFYYVETVSSLDFGRCILYEKNHVTNGRCVSARCSLGHVWIKLRTQDANWIKCSSGEIIEDAVDGGFISCPIDEETFCFRRKQPTYLHDLVTLEATTVTDRPRATHVITQGNMYSVEQITNGRRANIALSSHTSSLNTVITMLMFIVVKQLIKL